MLGFLPSSFALTTLRYAKRSEGIYVRGVNQKRLAKLIHRGVEVAEFHKRLAVPASDIGVAWCRI